MRKYQHTILCYIIAISLVVLPFSVPAQSSLQVDSKTTCHDMEANHSMSVMDIVSVTSQVDSHLMVQSNCCDNNCCSGDCACADMTVCANSVGHASPFIVFDQYSVQLINHAQASFEQTVQYFSLTSLPNFRPPIV